MFVYFLVTAMVFLSLEHRYNNKGRKQAVQTQAFYEKFVYLTVRQMHVIN